MNQKRKPCVKQEDPRECCFFLFSPPKTQIILETGEFSDFPLQNVQKGCGLPVRCPRSSNSYGEHAEGQVQRLGERFGLLPHGSV